MKRVVCVSKRAAYPSQIKEGKKYWMDETSSYKDGDGDEYAMIYADESKSRNIGFMLTSHFKEDYRYLKNGLSLSSFVNSKTSFMLQDIIDWCVAHANSNSVAEYVLLYIHDNCLNIPENMEAEFVVNNIPYDDFAERNREDEYSKYMGYSLYCVN